MTSESTTDQFLDHATAARLVGRHPANVGTDILGVSPDENGRYSRHKLIAARGRRRNIMKARNRRLARQIGNADYSWYYAEKRREEFRHAQILTERITTDCVRVVQGGREGAIWRVDLPKGFTWGLTWDPAANPFTAPMFSHGTTWQEALQPWVDHCASIDRR
ncbi:hypothetical protein [Nocardia salmonicida]|uniref:hypothetical protein n=1 Tax=Nocardia salmonicida TaxID=53431 RepID=UPI000AF496C9|nr:hypothetical protein [Nocardia salmonicida]